MMRITLLFVLFTARLWAQLSSNAPNDLAHGLVKAPATLKDFSLVVEVTKQSPQSAEIQSDGFKLSFSGSSVRVEVAGSLMEAPLAAESDHVLTVVIKRDPRQALSGLWIDGVEVRSTSVPPGTTVISEIPKDSSLYDRPLTRSEIIECSQKVQEPQGWVVIGGSEAVAIMESGYLEALWMPKEPVRCLAWEGDTVFKQDRPLNFGTLEDQIARLRPKRILAMFGRQECLEYGEAGLADFVKKAKPWAVQTLFIGALPFEKMEPPMRDLSDMNDVLKKYNQALAKLSGSQFIDLSGASMRGLTRDGVTLTDAGCLEVSKLIARALGAKSDAVDAKVLTLVREKNRLWHNYWRPSNWAFLYGDRTAQPSSRDHLDPKVRWFPGELEEYRTLITAKEQAIWNLTPALP
ncbi:MAG: hypothetical protein JNJ83_23600 [Verrucomicrobiaceae bacterium]|nr:hypothetical protein [Verrucomicrobiaceae bacterium]